MEEYLSPFFAHNDDTYLYVYGKKHFKDIKVF